MILRTFGGPGNHFISFNSGQGAGRGLQGLKPTKLTSMHLEMEDATRMCVLNPEALSSSSPPGTIRELVL